jgi:LCP family protein required for cell wall assembly
VVSGLLHAGDSSDVGGYNTNTLILLHVPGNGSKATAISIPRDDYVNVPGYGMQKIKEAYGLAKADADSQLYAKGVPEPLREQEARDAGRRSTLVAVQNFIHVPIDHFAEVNLIGFYDIVSALGPITVCLNAPVNDSAFSGALFPAGVQKLNASQALAFVRQRNGLPNNDLDRTHRQQAFIAAVTNKLKTTGVFGDLGKISALINVTKKDIVIDDKLDPLKLALEASNLTSGNVDFYTLPIEGYATENGQSVNLVDPARVQAEVQALLNPPKSTPAAAPPKPVNAAGETVDIYNGANVANLASQTSAALTAKGYRKGVIASINVQTSTAVTYGTGAGADAATIAKTYAVSATADPNLAAGHIRVNLGSDVAAKSSGTIPSTGAQGAAVHASGGIPCVN